MRAWVFVLFTAIGCASPGSGAPDAGDDARAPLDCSSGDGARGAELAGRGGISCTFCHGFGLEGQPSTVETDYFPNITPTAIGGWTDDQLADAIRLGRHPSGATLCARMPRRPEIDDAGVCDVIAWVRSFEPQPIVRPAACASE